MSQIPHASAHGESLAASVTALQQAMLQKIATNEYTEINGAEPETAQETITWAEMIIESAQDKGVFTSLLNAELVFHNKCGKDSTVGLTDNGFKIYKSLAGAK